MSSSHPQQTSVYQHLITVQPQDIDAMGHVNKIDYLRPAMPGQTLIATTWVDNYKGVRSDRIVQLTHQETGKLLTKAKTTWCLLDAQTARPKRIEDDIAKVFGNPK